MNILYRYGRRRCHPLLPSSSSRTTCDTIIISFVILLSSSIILMMRNSPESSWCITTVIPTTLAFTITPSTTTAAPSSLSSVSSLFSSVSSPSTTESTSSTPLSSSPLFQSSSPSLSSNNMKKKTNNKIIKIKNRNKNKNKNKKHDDWLKGLGFPRGLRNTILDSIGYGNSNKPRTKRIWIVDNSGSMKMMDGHEMLPSSTAAASQQKQKKQISHNGSDDDNKVLVRRNNGSTNNDHSSGGDATRWAELQETVLCHAHFLSILDAPTEFKLLNPPSNGRGPRKFRVGYNKMMTMGSKSKSATNHVKKIMDRNKPKGKTPLHEAIMDVRKDVVKMLPQLLLDGTHVTVVICTDGCNNNANADNNSFLRQNNDANNDNPNKELEDALESLRGLPVNVVIRLCTDYPQIVDYYNSLDERNTIVVSNENDENDNNNNLMMMIDGSSTDNVAESSSSSLSLLPSFSSSNKSSLSSTTSATKTATTTAGATALSLDVIDDYESEAAQVQEYNPWLNYALVLHRIREMGLQKGKHFLYLLDVLDQRSFTLYEIRDFVALLFGTASDLIPDPLCDTDNFIQEINSLQKDERMHWNPSKMKITPWIDTEELMVAMQ